MKLFGTQTINDASTLVIGGVDVKTLQKQFGTPLYVMDETHIRNQCRWFTQHFVSERVRSEVIYASKAFLTIAMCRLIEAEGLSLDVVSGGELYTAFKAGFPMERVYFHGNNKSAEELSMALKHNVGTIILDNENELDMLLKQIKPPQTINVLLRLNPGIEAHTHEYIATTKNDSKFGLSVFAEKTLDVIRRIDASDGLCFRGFHSHIGSQIFEEASFIEHARAIMKYVAEVKDATGIEVEAINLGGGFGVRYTEEDRPIDNAEFLNHVLDTVFEEATRAGVTVPRVMIEPGRAIVANAGTTLYEVGSTKTTFSGRNYVFVDGSMADHIRTSLYGAEYHGVLANRMDEKPLDSYTVTGKACESGDIIIRHLTLPTPEKGDLLAVFSTGAYHYSMASNYNRLQRPAVVFVKEGKATCVVRRESYDDLIRNDVDVRL